MAKNLSALKRDQISLRNNIRNKIYKSMIKTSIKKVLLEINSLKSTDDKQLNLLMNQAYSILDKAVKRGAISKNSAARKKSNLSYKLKTKEF